MGSVVLPRYLEPPEVVCASIERLLSYFRQRRRRVEIIVVNDGGSPLQIEEHADLKLITLGQNRGKGAAVQAGVAVAESELVAYCDVDLPVDVDDFGRAFDSMCAEKWDLFVGSRFSGSLSPAIRAGRWRDLASRTFRWGFHHILVSDIPDPQCPMKVIRRCAAHRLFDGLIVPGYSFDAEVLYRARRLGLSYLVIPVAWKDTRGRWGLAKTMEVFGRQILDLVRIRLFTMRAYRQSDQARGRTGTDVLCRSAEEMDNVGVHP